MKSILIFTLVSLIPISSIAGKLDDVRDEIKKPKTTKTSSSSSWSSGSSNKLSDAEGFFYGVMVLASPFWLPYGMVEAGQWSRDPGFLDWPYRGGSNGYGTDRRDVENSWDAFAGRLQLEGGLASWGYRASGDLRISFDSRFDLNLAGFGLLEVDENDQLDVLHFYEAGGSWNFALGQNAQFRFGVDLVMMIDPGSKVVPGFTATYSVDWFPVDPLVMTLELGAGYLDDKFYGHSEFTLGIALGPVEPFIGYEVRTIGSQYLGTAAGGLRVWF